MHAGEPHGLEPRPDSSLSSMRLICAYLLGCAFFAYGFVHRVATSVMTGELMRDFSVGGSELGSLSAMYFYACLLYTSPSPRDQRGSRMPSSA